MENARDKKAWSESVDSLYKVYVPGAEPPPVEGAWTYKKTEYYWIIEIIYSGDSSTSRGKAQLVKTYHRPKLESGCILWVWGDEGEEYISAVSLSSVKTFSVKRYETKIFYKLEGLVVPKNVNEKSKYKVNYMRNEPKLSLDRSWIE